MEALERAARDVGALVVRDIELDAVSTRPDGLRLGGEVGLEDGGIALEEDGRVRRRGDVAVVDALDEVARGGGRAEEWLVGDVEVEVEVVWRGALRNRNHPVRDVWVGQIGVRVGPAGLVDSALRRGESQVGGGVLVLVGVAERIVTWGDGVSVLAEGGDGARCR